MRAACVVLLVLFLDSTGSGHEEKDFQCPYAGVSVPATSVCNGLLDCTLPPDVSRGDSLSDESTDICAPTHFLDSEILLESRDVTSTSAQLSWSKATTHVSNDSLKLAGYFVTGKSEPHAFHNTISGRLHSYQARWLKPWTHYTLILRPFYTESGKRQDSYKIGRAASVNILTLTSDSYEISAHAVDSRTAVISWRASELVEFFKLTLYTDSHGKLRFHRSWAFEGTNKMSSRCTVPVNDLQPWTYYMASLEGCSGEICSSAVNTTLITPPTELPGPSVTRVEATSNSSFEIAWEFSQNDTRLYDGFRGKYCPSNIASCVEFETNDKNLTVHGLDPGTTVQVYVRAQFSSSDGRLLVGYAAAAAVTTWKDTPDLVVTLETNVQDEVATCLLRWVCVNSSVDYIQYRESEGEEWTTCSDSADCDITINNGRTAALSSGYLRLTHQIPQDYFTIWIRGCNNHGCGRQSHLSQRSQSAGPPSLSTVTILLSKFDPLLRWNVAYPSGYDGIEVTWRCNGSKKTFNRIRISDFSHYETYKEASLKGIPANAEHCKFLVSTYRHRSGGWHYGPPMDAILQ
ncbi:uncharacterized protein LOC142566576 isoform X2 [Dermacentor variabilis]|uniref:uncharacterized protein LOC142566576 isoform X2 n=1 Tax=Dermacentor variabilis TaxID=34621 RepID=UPI003F5B3CAC